MDRINKDIAKQQTEYYNTYLKIKNNPRYKKIWKYLKKNNCKGRILDIGCANGDFSEPLVKKGYDCYGLELMDEAIKESADKGIKVIKGSFIEKFPYNNNLFDIVFAGEVIEHTTNDDKFLQEINRVLKPGGLIVLTTPNLVSFGNRLLILFGKLPRFAYAEFHYRIYNQELIKKKIRNTGFKITKIESSYVLVSTFFNKFFGLLGESLGTFLPGSGEHFIIYARKK